MPLSEVRDVNVVPDAGSVRGGIVVSENAKFLALAGNHFLDKGEQVVGVDIRLVTDKPGLVRTTRVKIAQGDDPPILVQFGQGVEKHLDCGLGLTIWGGGVLHVSLAAVVLVTIDCRSRGEDEVLAVILLHHLKEIGRPDDVVLEVEDGFLDGFGDGF